MESWSVNHLDKKAAAVGLPACHGVEQRSVYEGDNKYLSFQNVSYFPSSLSTPPSPSQLDSFGSSQSP